MNGPLELHTLTFLLSLSIFFSFCHCSDVECSSVLFWFFLLLWEYIFSQNAFLFFGPFFHVTNSLKEEQYWVFIGRTDAEDETPILWPPDVKNWLICKTMMQGKTEGGRRGWDGWMASPTWWTWVWVNSGSWWWTGRPGMLRFMGSQRVGHDWATELSWTELIDLLHLQLLRI